jgi:hypothetical protein
MTTYLDQAPNRATERVISAVANHFFVEPSDVLSSRSRLSRVALARQIAMYVLREYQHPRPSYPELAREFGRDHTTVIAAFRSVTNKAVNDEHVRAAIEVGRLALETVSMDAEITRLELLRRREMLLGELLKVDSVLDQKIGAAG